jgi:hypothetical protein
MPIIASRFMTADASSSLGPADETAAPLVGDPERAAVASIRGYAYQIVHTALAWARLKKGQTIYLEGAEDFDRLGRVNEAVQVKDYQRPITLRTPAVKEFICNAWLNRERNPQRNVLSRMLTTAKPTMEHGAPFASPGITFWRETAGKDPDNEVLARAAALGRFILDYAVLPEKMVEVLRRANAREIFDNVITPITFDVGLVATDGIEQELRALLALVATEDGFRLTNVDNALNATLKFVWDTVVKKSDRLLNIGMLTDVLIGTIRTVPPKGGSETVQESLQAVGIAFAGPQLPTAEQPQFALASVLRELPPVAPMHLDRVELIEAARSVVRRANIVIINGPRYVGKSTLAADVGRNFGDRWAWVEGSSNSAVTVRQALHELRTSNQTFGGVVLDGLPQNDVQLAAELLHLFEVCHAGHIAVVVVPDGDFAALIKQRLGIAPEMEVLVGPFNNGEVTRLLRARGCPDNRLQAWTRALELTAAGDPVLVGGGVARIERAGFPQPAIDDIFGPRPELEELRRDIRLIAARDLEAAQFEMLNRLSISLDAYSRPVALRIAEENPAIPAPGNALDALVGIWVQEVVQQRYRVIGLARDFGKQTYGEEWNRRMHHVAAGAILEQPHITTVEAANALSHAFAAEDGGVAVQILHQVITLDGDTLDGFAKAASWLPMCYTGDARRPDFIPRDEWWVLRAAQIRVSARSHSNIPLAVIEAFDVEFPSGSDLQSVRLARLVVLSEMLIRSSMAGLTYTQIARCGIEWAALARQLRSNDALDEVVRALRGRDGPIPANSGLYVVGFTALATIKSASSLLELISAVAAHGLEVAAAFFGAMNDDRHLAYGLLLPLWNRYIGEDGPEWEQAVESLIDSAHELIAMGSATAADEALAGAIRLLTERGSAESALRRADELLVALQGRALTSLLRAKTRASMLNLQYGEAAQTWRDLLPTVRWDGTDFDLYSDYRDAAISFARADAWSDAAEVLQAGAARVDQAALGKWKAAMEIDAAAAFFRAKQYESAVAPLLRGCRVLSTIEIDQNVDADYMIMKRIGHTIFWMSDPREQSEKGFDAPPAAAASWLDTTRPPSNLPPTEVDMLLAMASQYAYMYGTLEETISFDSRILYSPHPIARVQAFIVSIHRNAELGDASALIDSLAGLERASDDLERRESPAPRGRSSISEQLFAIGLIVPGLQNRIDATFIAASRERAHEVGLYNSLRDVINEAEQVFVIQTIDPREQLYTAEGTMQILVSVAFAATLGNRPEAWVTVHTLWAEVVLRTFRQPAGALLYRLLSARWAILAENRICLSRPAVTAPRLLAAISSHDELWSKIACLLKAAADAAGSLLPGRVRQALDDAAYASVVAAESK